MIDWLIIGGGVHGTYLSNLLTAEAGVPPDAVRVIDPHDRPLALWDRYAANCGMRHLRSPATHNIGIHILSLYRFARSNRIEDPQPFVPPYNRPSAHLFRRHCDDVIRRRRLADLRIAGRVTALRRAPRGVTAVFDRGRMTARRVLLCIGQTEQPAWPDWADRLVQEGAPIRHVFDAAFDAPGASANGRTVVIGGGLTAVQTALSLASGGSGHVAILSPHDPLRSNFDFDPCWIGPKCLRDFVATAVARRRRLIDAARISGSLPEEVFADLVEAVETGRLTWTTAGIRKAEMAGDRIRLHLTSGEMTADRAVLATGFAPSRPGGALIDRAISEFSLKTDRSGYPVIGDDLRWEQAIYVSGPLAELRIGPCARNIVGARNAGRLLLAHLSDRSRSRS